MKKISLVLTLVIALVISVTTATTSAFACPPPSTNDSSNITYVDPLERTELLELPYDEYDLLQQYRAEVCMRDNHPATGEYMVPEVELEVYEECGLEFDSENKCVYADDGYGAFIPWYEFPVIFNTGDVKQLCYTDDQGMLCYVMLKRNDWRSVKYMFTDYNIHCDIDSGEILINTNPYFAITYNSEIGSVKVWMHGILIREHDIPTESIYAGLSTNEGYIFRSDNDVYAVRDYGCYCVGGTEGVNRIAQDVKLVIETDYCLGWEECAQPLFLMTDGTVKVFYSGISESGESEFIDLNDLYDITVDGGFWE